jgi:hypothetical protein
MNMRDSIRTRTDVNSVLGWYCHETRPLKNGNSLQRGLIQTMAALVAIQTAFQSEIREIERERREPEGERLAFQREAEERFRRIEAILELHTLLLQRLPEVIREKMGFRHEPQQ